MSAAQRLNRIVYWAVAVIPPVLALLAVIGPWWGRTDPVDYRSYVLGAQALFSGQSPYAPFQLAGPFDLRYAAGRGFVYPPSAALITAPFTLTRELWAFVNIAMLAIGCIAILHRYRLLNPVSVVLVAWAIVIHPGTTESLAIGSVSPAVAGLLGLAAVGGPAWLLGIGGAVKLFPAAWIAVDARSRTRGQWIAFAVGLLTPAVLSLALAGPTPWIDYIQVFGNAEPSCRGLASFPCAGAPPLLMYGVAGVLVLMAAFGQTPVGMIAVVAAVLVLAPDIWYHYLLLLIPAGVAIVASIVARHRDRQVVAGVP
jgi:hypothetical protein